MKRLVLLGVSLALILSCFIVNGSKQGIHAGAGFGFGKSVDNPEELLPLLEFIVGGDSSDGFLENSEADFPIVTLSNDVVTIPENLSAESSREMFNTFFTTTLAFSKDKNSKKDKDDDDDDKKKKSKNEYESATISIETNLSASSSRGTQKMSRSMTIYITEDATFYRSKGQTSINISYQTVDKDSKYGSTKTEYQKTAAIFDIDILRMDDEMYFYFREFSMSSNDGSMQIKNEYREKWIEMPDFFVSDIVSLDSQNRSAFRTMGELIEMLLDSGDYKKSDKIIELDEGELSDLYDEELDGNTSVNFKMDFSSPATPMISYAIGYSEDTSGSVKANETIVFSNVNNTVISFNDSCVDVEADTEKECEKLFLIYEVDEDDRDD